MNKTQMKIKFTIPFNKPYLSGKEFNYMQQACENRKLSGDGQFSKKCQTWLEQQTGCSKALLTNSCTAALEMAAILIDTRPSDEIIMPSYTFVSTANAFVLRGGIPIFIDIRPDTLNIDETKIEAAITPKTKAIVPVHYAGIGCELDIIMDIANRHGLYVIEDAAQGIMANYKSKALGSIGHLGTYSFHDSKNITCGEGGALLINDPQFIERAEIIHEKGTNRSKFMQGQVDKYTWLDIGSSFLASDLAAAFLLAQLEHAEEITKKRLTLWNKYHDAFSELEKKDKLRRPIIPESCQHNAHMYYLLLPNKLIRDSLILELQKNGIQSVFHYIPLHNSPGGKKYGRAHGNFAITNDLSQRLLRLPFSAGLQHQSDAIINNIISFLSGN